MVWAVGKLLPFVNCFAMHLNNNQDQLIDDKPSYTVGLLILLKQKPAFIGHLNWFFRSVSFLWTTQKHFEANIKRSLRINKWYVPLLSLGLLCNIVRLEEQNMTAQFFGRAVTFITLWTCNSACKLLFGFAGGLIDHDSIYVFIPTGVLRAVGII